MTPDNAFHASNKSLPQNRNHHKLEHGHRSRVDFSISNSEATSPRTYSNPFGTAPLVDLTEDDENTEKQNQICKNPITQHTPAPHEVSASNKPPETSGTEEINSALHKEIKDLLERGSGQPEISTDEEALLLEPSV